MASNTASGSARFGIGEWYGHSFVDLSRQERLKYARFKPKGKCLSRKDRDDLVALQAIPVKTLAPKKKKRLETLKGRAKTERQGHQPCPFRTTLERWVPCTKRNGVCSMRLYRRADENAPTKPASEPEGSLRAICPYRLHESDEVFAWASDLLLGKAGASMVREVGFLESQPNPVEGEVTADTEEPSETEAEPDGKPSDRDGKDVGRIDMILADTTKPSDYPLPWGALEIQAVYFSGPEMPGLIRQIKADCTNASSADGIVFPDRIRRPDYRSSGPKRLMPQLQIKVPTLRRWGKKMAVVVDRSFFASLRMQAVTHISNADIAWLVVKFVHDPTNRRFVLRREDKAVYTTLEEAVIGLTGGKPVTKDEFEQRIREKLASE